MAPQTQDLTQGKVHARLLIFAVPFLLTNLLQILYNLSDTVIISYFIGVEGVSAANSGGQVMTVAVNIITGLAVGGTVIIGQLAGAKDWEKVKRTIGTFLTVMFVVGVVFTVFFVIFSRDFLIMINTPSEVLEEATAFLRIYSYGIMFLFGYNAIAAVSRGVGDSKAPMLIVLVTSILNSVADLVLIGFFGMGLRGAAWSSTIAIILSFIMAAVHLGRQTDLFRVTRAAFRIDGGLLFRVLKVGVPCAIQSSIFGMSILLVTSRINAYGVEASAVAGLGSKIDSVILLPLNALAAATAAMMAQNLGAGEIKRVRQTLYSALGYGYGFAIAAFVTAQLIPGPLFRLITGDPAAIELGAVYLRWISYNYLFVTALLTFNSVAIGAGNTVYPLCTTIMNGFVFRVPIALFFEQTLGFGLAGVFMGLGFANIGGMIAGFIYYRLGLWARPKKTAPPGVQALEA